MRSFPKPYNASTKDRIIRMIIDDIHQLIGPGRPGSSHKLVILFKSGEYGEVIDILGECAELAGFGTALMYLSLAQFDDDLVKEFDVVCQNVLFWVNRLSIKLANDIDFQNLPDDEKEKFSKMIQGKSGDDPEPDLSAAEIYVQGPPEKYFG